MKISVIEKRTVVKSKALRIAGFFYYYYYKQDVFPLQYYADDC